MIRHHKVALNTIITRLQGKYIDMNSAYTAMAVQFQSMFSEI